MSFTHCRVWDGQNMHYLSSVFTQQPDFVTVWLEDALVLINLVAPKEKRRYEPTSPWRLMLSVGQPDCQGSMIYDQDIVETNGHFWIVRHHADRCGFSLFLPNAVGLASSLFLDKYLAESLMVVGNCLEDPHLLAGNYAQRQAA
jgi:hypothetical protein